MNRTAELRTLKAFVIVAREGSISRAAEILNLTQPAVSLQLKRLAEDTGLTLFRRASKGMELTADGARLAGKAEKVFTALSDFSETATRISGQVRERLRIGTIVDPEFIRLGQFLARLVQQNPYLRAELSHGMSGEVITRLLDNKIDAGYFLGELELLESPELTPKLALIHQVELTRITYRVIAPAGWENLIETKPLAELSDLPWIGTPPESVHSRILNRLFAEHGRQQNQVALVDQEPVMLAMVQSSVGLSLCQEATALEQRQSRGLAVAENIKIETPLSFVTLGSRLQEPNISAAISGIQSIWSS